MRRKEKWMFLGAIVIALGKKGTITEMQENNLNGIDFVYNIYVQYEGSRITNPHHPNDIKELTL